MFKTGIYDLSQLTDSPRFNSLLGKKRVISIALYNQILHASNADALAERILDTFSDERGAYKRTYSKRFETFDAQLLRMLAERNNIEYPLVVADVSVSDGRTACDLFETLAPQFPELEYLASDFSPQVFVVRKGRFSLAVSRQYNIVEMTWPPFVLSALKPETPYYYPVNAAVRLLVHRLIAKPLLAQYKAGNIGACEIQLFSARALNLARNDPRFHLGDQNILEPITLPKPAHLLRAMNVLNATYFNHDDMKVILTNFHKALRPDGWLVAGSNEDAGSVVNGGIFRKTTGGFEKIWHSGNGLEREAEITGWKARTQRVPTSGA